MRGHVLAERGQEIAERRERQRMPRDRVGEFRERRLRRRPARGDGVERALEAVERGEALRGRRVALVGDVVGGAREPVDREHRCPHRAGKQERRDGKILVVGGRHE